MAEQIKKSYNPFKMWGSWVGFIIGSLDLLISGILIKTSISISSITVFLIELLQLGTRGASSGTMMFFLLLTMLLNSIIGFLLGWAIHSLIRRFKN